MTKPDNPDDEINFFQTKKKKKAKGKQNNRSIFIGKCMCRYSYR